DDLEEKDVEMFKNIWKNKVDRIRIYQEHSTGGKFGSLKVKKPYRKTCVMPFYQMTVYYNGLTGRCNHDWGVSPMGNIKKNRIKKIWNSKIYTDLRKQHLSLDIKDIVCSQCDSWYEKIGVQGTGEVIE
ncbi:MAG: SPASM domain-containing protein, partial [Candidatus Firestonebacteria bacterium]